LVNYDEVAQDRINALNVEKANTRVAEQSAKTAEAQARANGILAESVSNGPLGCWPNTSVVPSVPAR
jgi:hypothetical protein